jgi:hexosaminidase
VAERLWSAQDVNDVDNMYQRLQAMDSWSTVSVGLQQHTQQQVQFTRLAGNADTCRCKSSLRRWSRRSITPAST